MGFVFVGTSVAPSLVKASQRDPKTVEFLKFSVHNLLETQSRHATIRKAGPGLRESAAGVVRINRMGVSNHLVEGNVQRKGTP